MPWEDLGLKPKAGLKIRGDVGLLLSDRNGAETAVRAYLFNQDTQIVSDVGNEARLQPDQWGQVVFE